MSYLKHNTKISIIFSLFMLTFALSAPTASAQGVPDLPANFMEGMDSGEGGENSLAKMLKMDLMKRFIDTQKEQEEKQSGRRPEPELGQRRGAEEPLDISKFIGPDGDSEKTLQTLRDKGKIPNQSIPAPPPGQATGQNGTFDNVSPEKRLNYVEDLMERRRFQQAEEELNTLLSQKLEKEQKIKALTLREKALFHNRHYDVVENDFFRLKAYYPESEAVNELKSYLDKEAGLAELKKQVKSNPQNAETQYKLLQQYKQYGWMDFAEEFFANEINDTSPPTIKSLSEIYYNKNDYQMLVELSKLAQEMHPSVADFPYNEGVGHYMQGGPFAKQKSLEAFKKARVNNPSPALAQKMNWYLKRLLNLQ